MKKQLILAIALLAASVILAVVSWLALPETVTTQVSLGGSSATTMPKLVAVALPALLGAGGAAAALFGKSESHKPLIVSGVGVLIFVVMLLVNR